MKSFVLSLISTTSDSRHFLCLAVGDFRNGWIDFGWDSFDEETKLQKRAVELNNGRAAMMGILGLMVHEKIVPLGYDPDLPIIGHLH